MLNSVLGETIPATETLTHLASPPVQTQQSKAAPNQVLSAVPSTSRVEDRNEGNGPDEKYD